MWVRESGTAERWCERAGDATPASQAMSRFPALAIARTLQPGAQSDLHSYSCSQLIWRTLTPDGPAPSPRVEMGLAALGDRLYVFGGYGRQGTCPRERGRAAGAGPGGGSGAGRREAAGAGPGGGSGAGREVGAGQGGKWERGGRST
jgi:hypothetical protein